MMPASVSPRGLSSFHAASNIYCILINHLFKHSGGDKKHIKGNMQQQLIDAWFSLLRAAPPAYFCVARREKVSISLTPILSHSLKSTPARLSPFCYLSDTSYIQ
jgi:hypothetical protein